MKKIYSFSYLTKNIQNTFSNNNSTSFFHIIYNDFFQKNTSIIMEKTKRCRMWKKNKHFAHRNPGGRFSCKKTQRLIFRAAVRHSSSFREQHSVTGPPSGYPQIFPRHRLSSMLPALYV